MKVRDIMTKDLTAVEKDMPVRELIFILNNAEMPNVPVVDEEGRLTGIISEKDLIRAALPGYFEMLHSTSFIPDMNQLSRKLSQIADQPIEKFVRTPVMSVTEDDDDLQAADLIIRKGVKNVPVVDGDGRLVGRVRRIDLLRHFL
ncbi:CBS domain-containing protein [Candidatus Bipolaricaulota bacterium]|nr:CBS domain-containing protein [Candidatus Bipolaricaulota bacterium]TFH11125.1 MAG: CBS domain-containing protein [Candidatus Atribacteria bacterium]